MMFFTFDASFKSGIIWELFLQSIKELGVFRQILVIPSEFFAEKKKPSNFPQLLKVTDHLIYDLKRLG
jgi:hypothetical protein